ncbi:MAG: hypothetical protein V8R85_03760 [Frisingicoccus sp.]
MVPDDRMQEEIDRATTAVGMVNEVDLYSLLLRIKHAQNRDEVLDRELKLCRFKLENVWRVDKKSLEDLEKCKKTEGG